MISSKVEVGKGDNVLPLFLFSRGRIGPRVLAVLCRASNWGCGGRGLPWAR